MHFNEQDLPLPSFCLPWAGSPSAPEEGGLQADSSHTLPAFNAEELALTKLRLVGFIGELGEHRKSHLRADVLAHVQQLNSDRKVISSYVSDESIQRMASARMTKMLKNKKVKKNWSEEDVKVLVWIVSKYCDKNKLEVVDRDMTWEDWESVASLIPGASAQSCMFKWLNLRKVTLSEQSWTANEELILNQVVERQTQKTLGSNSAKIDWKEVSESFYNLNRQNSRVFRSAKQCRQHWNCFLNPEIKKGPWKKEEDFKLLSMINNNLFETRWAEMMPHFQGRTENAIKNRFNLLMDKQRKVSKSKQEQELIRSCLNQCKNDLEEEKKKTNVKVQQEDLPLEKVEEEKEEKLPTKERLEITDISESEQVKKKLVVENIVKVVIDRENRNIISGDQNYLALFRQLSSGNGMENVRPGCLVDGRYFQPDRK